MSEYKYFCIARQPQLGNVPSEGLQYVDPFMVSKYVYQIKAMAWGCVVYNRLLTDEEIAVHDLIPAPDVAREKEKRKE